MFFFLFFLVLQLSEASATLGNTSSSMENLLKDLRNAEKIDQVTEKSADKESKDEEDKNDIVALSAPSEVVNNDMSPADSFTKNIAEAFHQMHTDGILTNDEQEKLFSSENLEDLGQNAGKVLLEKYTENPKPIVSLLKKLFD